MDLPDYRGPYFRTGVDAAGNYWELTPGSSNMKKQQLSRSPSTWDIKKPKEKLQSFENQLQQMPLNTIPGMTRQAPHHQGLDVQNNNLIPINGSFVTKDYLKSIIKEIWNEEVRPYYPPPTPAPAKAHQSPKSSKTKVRESKEKVATGPAAKKVQSVVSYPSNPAPAPGTILMRPKCPPYLGGMACDPPTTPPASESSITLPATNDYTTKKHLKKSKRNASRRDLDPKFDQQVNQYPTQLQRFLFPQQAFIRPLMGMPQRPPKQPVETRPQVENFNSLNSTLTVRRLPLMDRFFMDNRMIPGVLSPQPKKKPTKKGLDPSGSQQKPQNSMQSYSHQTQMIPFPSGAEKAKRDLPSKKASKKLKKPIHSSKMFPVHIPGPTKENMYIGPYIDSEVDLLRNKLEIRSK